MRYRFGEYTLDTDRYELSRAGQPIALRPKVFAVLQYLLRHHERVVTKSELLTQMWPQQYIGDATLNSCIKEVRQAVGDTGRNQRILRTVRGRGYRIVATVERAADEPSPTLVDLKEPEVSSTMPGPVGRHEALQHLHDWLQQALRGERQIVFVTGEAGIGKTTLVDALLAQVRTERDLWHARGQCVEPYGAGEAYLPILDALGRLCRTQASPQVIAVLERYAPMWLAQLPALLSPEAQQRLQQQLVGATRDRMLREIAEALEALTTDHPLVLCLEDLHWSDEATVHLLAYLARRQESARLFVLCTYRPTQIGMPASALDTVLPDLQIRKPCRVLPLQELTGADVEAYIAKRFPARTLPPALAQTLHRRTGGHPLFMVHLVDHLTSRALLPPPTAETALQASCAAIETEMPATLLQLITQQLEQLSVAQQQMLEVASLVGETFSAAVVAAACHTETVHVEQECDTLAHQNQFLQSAGTAVWPDETVAALYRFTHALYREVLCQRPSVTRRTHLHQSIGRRLETAYGDHASSIAGELAGHFEHGRLFTKAIQYYQHAGEHALQRHAPHEAVGHLRHALELLETRPESPERRRQELDLCLALGTALLTTHGAGAPDVGRTYERARRLCEQLGAVTPLFRVLGGLWGHTLIQAQLPQARELAQHRLWLAQQQQDPIWLVLAHVALGITLFYLGELCSARTNLEQGLALYDPQQYWTYTAFDDLDPGVTGLAYAAVVVWLRGDMDQARAYNQQALRLARQLAHPPSEALALSFSAWLHQVSRKTDTALAEAQRAIALAQHHGYAQWLVVGGMLQGLGLAAGGQWESGLAQFHAMLTAYRTHGARLSLSYWLVTLAELYCTAGQPEAGLQALGEAEAAAKRQTERYYEAEIYRLRGTLLQQQVQGRQGTRAAAREAEAWLHQATHLAHQQGAKMLELRAAVSLGRLWQQQGRHQDVYQHLQAVCGWFPEGCDLADVRDARTLLEELHERATAKNGSR